MNKKINYWMVLAIVTVVCAMSLAALVTPAAADSKVLVGDQIHLEAGPTIFPANTPFHILHSWIFHEGDKGFGLYDFTLDIDGNLQTEDFIDSWMKNVDGVTLVRSWVFNYPEGLIGEHTFTGHWYAPCKDAVEFFEYPGPCPTPITKIEVGTRILTVTFTP